MGFALSFTYLFMHVLIDRSRWPRRLRRGSAVDCLLGLWVLIPPEAWMSVSCACWKLSSRSICDGTISRPEESYRVCVRACVCGYTYASLSAIWCSHNPRHLQWAGTRCQSKKNEKKTKKTFVWWLSKLNTIHSGIYIQGFCQTKLR